MTHLANSPKLLLLQQLAVSAGTQGMVAGQAADIEGETKQLALEELAFIHERKTGRLIHYALLAGGVLADQPEEVVGELQQLARHLGLAFQIRDDLLDVISTTEELGKTAGKDAEMEKNTYPRLLGIEKTKTALKAEITSANEIIERLEQTVYSFKGQLLRQLVQQFDIGMRKKMEKERVDVLAVKQGLFETREQAKRSVMAGLIYNEKMNVLINQVKRSLLPMN